MYQGRRPEDDLYQQLYQEAAGRSLGAPGSAYGGGQQGGGMAPVQRRAPVRDQKQFSRPEEPSGWSKFAEVALPIVGMAAGGPIGGAIGGGAAGAVSAGLAAGSALGSAGSEAVRMTRDPRAQTQPNRMGDMLAQGATQAYGSYNRPTAQQAPPPQSKFAPLGDNPLNMPRLIPDEELRRWLDMGYGRPWQK